MTQLPNQKSLADGTRVPCPLGWEGPMQSGGLERRTEQKRADKTAQARGSRLVALRCHPIRRLMARRREINLCRPNRSQTLAGSIAHNRDGVCRSPAV